MIEWLRKVVVSGSDLDKPPRRLRRRREDRLRDFLEGYNFKDLYLA